MWRGKWMEAVGVCNPIALWFLLLYAAVRCCSKSSTAETFFSSCVCFGISHLQIQNYFITGMYFRSRKPYVALAIRQQLCNNGGWFLWMLAFAKSCQEPSCTHSSSVDFLPSLTVMEVITKSIKKSIAWDFCNSFASYILGLLEREDGRPVYKIRIRRRLSA